MISSPRILRGPKISQVTNVRLLLEQNGYNSQAILIAGKGFGVIGTIQMSLEQAMRLKSTSSIKVIPQ